MQLTLSINIAQFCYKIAQISLHHQSSFDEIGFLEREFVSGFKIFFRSTIFRSECLPWLVKMWTPTSRRWKRFIGRPRLKRPHSSNRGWNRFGRRLRLSSHHRGRSLCRSLWMVLPGDFPECRQALLQDPLQLSG